MIRRHLSVWLSSPRLGPACAVALLLSVIVFLVAYTGPGLAVPALGTVMLTGSLATTQLLPPRCRPASSVRPARAAGRHRGTAGRPLKTPGRSGAVQQKAHLARVAYRVGRAAVPGMSEAPRVARGL